MKKKKKNKIEDLGIFNVLLIGNNPHAISIADNIKSSFNEYEGDDCINKFNFNIVEDIEKYEKSTSWFNEFIFEMTTVNRYNNIIIASEFHNWMTTTNQLERIYMKKLLQAMNTIIIDISDDENSLQFDEDIPQYKFNIEVDFLSDLCKWINGQISKIVPCISTIGLIRSLSGKNISYLGDVFGCLSGKKYEGIVKSDKMRFDVPILFDEFCTLTRGRSLDEIGKCVITRTSSALSVFFK